ncbi:hypothetical protein RhiirA1_402665 [Rhizophagus irregularis]|uniref:FAR1 domain-containing protein n=1 Tax=Rhizophagus irregularis TaxID=588596 RepID=A0A2N0QXG4_9GLOM|nr:hypothetical protein RhiirA1_402665 [Rhizophagus irregularis]
MDNVHKRHLFKVYSSADEGIDDVNELQDEYKSMSSEEDCVLFGLKVGDVFESCDSAEKQVVYCAKNNGFEVKKFRLKKNKKEIVCRTFKCKFFGVYRVQKKADIEDTHECKSITISEGQDEDGEDDKDYENSEDGEIGDYGDDDDDYEQSDNEE